MLHLLKGAAKKQANWWEAKPVFADRAGGESVERLPNQRVHFSGDVMCTSDSRSICRTLLISIL